MIVRELKGHKHGERHRNDDQPRNHAVRHFAGLIRMFLDRYPRIIPSPIDAFITIGRRIRRIAELWRA